MQHRSFPPPVSLLIHGHLLQDVFEVIYSSGGCVEAFHKKKGSRGVRLTGWGDGERSVSYSVAIQAPAVVTNIVGTLCPAGISYDVCVCIVMRALHYYTLRRGVHMCAHSSALSLRGYVCLRARAPRSITAALTELKRSCPIYLLCPRGLPVLTGVFEQTTPTRTSKEATNTACPQQPAEADHK